MIYMDKRHLNIVQQILAKYPYTFYAFGSRTKGTQRPLSDLDICFKEDIPWNIRAHIDEDFEESDLPFTVDIIDWNTCSPDFQARIAKDLVRISTAQSQFNGN
jgi:predicted nucleotidyltransferase